MAFLLSPQITIAAALGSIVLSKCSGWALYKIAATYTVAMVGCGAVGSLAGFYFGMRAVKKDPSAGIVAAFWTLIPSVGYCHLQTSILLGNTPQRSQPNYLWDPSPKKLWPVSIQVNQLRWVHNRTHLDSSIQN